MDERIVKNNMLFHLTDDYAEIVGCLDLKSQEIIEIPKEIEIDKKILPVTKICKEAFRNCKAKDFIIPDTITNIEDIAFESSAVFYDENNWDILNEMPFYDNHQKVFYFHDILVEAWTGVNGVYVIRPGTRIIAESAFADCRDLERINVPKSVKYINKDAFKNCPSLTLISIPPSVKKIDKQNISPYVENCLTIVCAPFSAAELWANENGYNVTYTMSRLSGFLNLSEEKDINKQSL